MTTTPLKGYVTVESAAWVRRLAREHRLTVSGVLERAIQQYKRSGAWRRVRLERERGEHAD